MVATNTPLLDRKLFRLKKLESEQVTAARSGTGPKIAFHPLIRHMKFFRHLRFQQVRVAWPNLSSKTGKYRLRPLQSIPAAYQESAFNLPFSHVELDSGYYQGPSIAQTNIDEMRIQCIKNPDGQPITVVDLGRALVKSADPDLMPQQSFGNYMFSEPRYDANVRFELWDKGHLSKDGKVTLRNAWWE